MNQNDSLLAIDKPDTVENSVSREDFFKRYAVSRETEAMLDRYSDMLVDWQSRMNLVGPATLADRWNRHFLDSAQLLEFAPDGPCTWLDMGSGAGFPGLVIAIMRSDVTMTLVDSRQKKCQFLAAVADSCGCGERTTILAERLENLPIKHYDVISARALAHLSQLFEWGLTFSNSSTRWILPKGSSAEEEVSLARQSYQFDFELKPSLTDADARIIVATNVRRRKRR